MLRRLLIATVLAVASVLPAAGASAEDGPTQTGPAAHAVVGAPAAPAVEAAFTA